MTEIKLDEARKYSGKYKGISFLISLHGVGGSYRPEGSWCYYIFIHEEQLPDEYRDDFILAPAFYDDGRVSHNYFNAGIANLDWHCGITYYGKEGGADGEKIVIKMGCDYGHYWDEGYSYDKEIILGDVQVTINKLFEIYPDIKIRSHYYGGYFKPIEGDFNEYGSFVSFEEKDKWKLEHDKKESSK